MNCFQEVWWEQARSDHAALLLLRRHGAAPCHQLHYLQMVTEKLAKAFFWRSGTPPPRSHAGFVQFMRFLGGVQQSKRPQIASALAFKSFGEFQSWTRAILPLVYDLERLAPALAQNGPNPEYPWPADASVHAPALFPFPVWLQLTNSGRGRQLAQVIQLAVDNFPTYG